MSSNRETEAVWLENLTWLEAETLLQQDRIVVVPLGAAAKEHGPHLPLNNDALIAGWLAREVAARLPVIVAPLINISFYPAFVDYPGSISLDAATARDFLLQTVGSLAAHGASRFYVLNTGVSTEGPLGEAQQLVQGDQISFEFLRLGEALRRLPDGLLEQGWGSHADEHETSLMLHIAPGVVDMSQAVDDGFEGQGRLSREPGTGTYSRSGVFGQPTLATEAKGEAIAAALLEQALADLKNNFGSEQKLSSTL